VQSTISIVAQGMPVLVPFVKLDLGLTRAEAGIFATVLSLGTISALLAAGWAVDVLGDRLVLVAGGLLTAILTLIACLAPNFLVLVPLLVLIGVGVATPTPAGSTAVMAAFPVAGRGFVMSIRQTGIPIGAMLAAVTLPSIAVAAGWRTALAVAALSAAVGAGIGWAMLRGAGSGAISARRGVPGSMRSVMSRKATMIGLAGVGLTFGQFTLASYIVLYLYETWRLPLVTGSLFLVASSLAGIAGRLGWGAISDRLFGGGRATPLVLVSLIAAGACVTLAWVPPTTSLAAVLVVVVIYGFTVVGWNGIWIALLSEIAPPDRRGRSVAYGMMVSHVGILFGPFLFGLTVDVTHSYRVAWSLVAGSLVASAALFWLVRERGVAGRPAAVEAEGGRP